VRVRRGRRLVAAVAALTALVSVVSGAPAAVAGPGQQPGGSAQAPRQEHGSADVRGADVRGADVRGADGQGADVRGAAGQGAAGRGAAGQGAAGQGAAGQGAAGQVFGDADGSTTRRLYDRVVNGRRADGSWAPLDLALTGGRPTPLLAPWPVSLAATAADGELVRLSLDAEHGVAFGVVGAAAAAGRGQRAQVPYPRARPATELRPATSAAGVTEGMVLASAAAPSSYDFALRLRGPAPSLDPAGGAVRLIDGGGKIRAVIPAGRTDPVRVESG
jgi:hypothetical protein